MRSLVGVHAAPTPRERKRWRRLVSTLREDLYLAEREHDDTLVGLAVIVYVRGLGPTTAVVRELHGVGDAAHALLDCARSRAAARGCERLEVDLAADATLAATLVADGWTEGARTLVRSLSP